MHIGSTIATLYFDSYRTYCAVFEPRPEGALALTYLNATSQPLDWKRPLAEMLDSPAMQELEALLQAIRGKVRSLGIAMTMESVLAHQIPYSHTLTTDELRRIVRLEVSEHLPSYDPSQFLATIYPLNGFASNPFTAMSVLVSRAVTGVAEHAAAFLGADLQRFVASQTAAHTAFAYNYPEERGVIALCGVQRGYMDVSVVRNSVLLHTATIALNTDIDDENDASTAQESDKTSAKQNFGTICASALQEAADVVQAPLDGVYFFGSDFTKAALDEVSGLLTSPAKRLNPLRQLSTTLEERLQGYASRVAHILVPSIGAALPEIQPGIILSSNLPPQRQPQRKIA